ncbi:uncharacterized protein TNCV_3261681 [Trichonephila clavipes]|nr:uncharacterized protein TNCV_3261681 [Trichonephila clavipes]
MDVCKRIVLSRHGGALNSRRAASLLVWLMEREERWENPDLLQGTLPQNWGGTELSCTVTCMVLKVTANDRRTSNPEALNRRFYLGIWTVKTVLNPISGQVFDAGHDESGVFLSAEWHDSDWLDDGIREATLYPFLGWTFAKTLFSGSLLSKSNISAKFQASRYNSFGDLEMIPIVEVEIDGGASYRNVLREFTELNRTITCMVLKAKANDRRTSSPLP